MLSIVNTKTYNWIDQFRNEWFRFTYINTKSKWK